MLWSTSVNFDVSVAEVFGTLCWGGKLVLVENALSLPEVAGQGIVYASMVPTAAAELLRAGAIPASVKTLNLGGEALPAELARALYATGTVEKVGNLYGPTEDTTYSTYSRVEKGAAQVRVGRPLANTQAYVLDARLQPVPEGVVGELYLAGDGTGARVCRGTGADGRALHAEPVRGGAKRFADVPGDGPGALAGRRGAGVPRAHRLPGQGARLPHRAGRDRDGAGAARSGAPGRGHGARGRRGRPADRRLRRRRGRRGLARRAAGEPGGAACRSTCSPPRSWCWRNCR